MALPTLYTADLILVHLAGFLCPRPLFVLNLFDVPHLAAAVFNKCMSPDPVFLANLNSLNYTKK
jgi:hypothetical protein